MRIVFVGAGRLATNLSQALQAADHEIVQVYSRTMESASQLAELLGVQATDDLASLRDADVYILSIKDSAMMEVIPSLVRKREPAVFLHTAGSMPMSVFKGYCTHYGVLYPMQTFSKDRLIDFSNVPFFIEGNDDKALQVAAALAGSVSKNVRQLSSSERKYLHLAAVFASNFVNHCYELSAEILQRHGIPFDVMLPLIDETADKVHILSPHDAQTGPAVRFDQNVIVAQMDLLKDTPQAQRIYQEMSKSIHLLHQHD